MRSGNKAVSDSGELFIEKVDEKSLELAARHAGSETFKALLNLPLFNGGTSFHIEENLSEVLTSIIGDGKNVLSIAAKEGKL